MIAAVVVMVADAVAVAVLMVVAVVVVFDDQMLTRRAPTTVATGSARGAASGDEVRPACLSPPGAPFAALFEARPPCLPIAPLRQLKHGQAVRAGTMTF